VVSDDVAAGTHGVAGGAVGAEDTGVAVKAGEVVGGTGVGLEGSAREGVVGLVGGVQDIAPEESSTDWVILV
jgi:hypothetical protein